MKIIILSGLDKTGKSTLMREILKQTSEFVIIERFAADQYVYNGIYYDNKGRTRFDKYLKLDNLLKDVGVYVFVTAMRKDIIKRMKETNEDKYSLKVKFMDYWLKRYEKYFSKTPLRVIKISTSFDEPKVVAKKIIDEVNKK